MGTAWGCAMTSLTIVLVHNCQADRLEYARPAIQEFIAGLDAGIKVASSEISWQPSITPHRRFVAFVRQLMYRKLARDWSRYRNDPRGQTGLGWFSFLWRTLRKYTFRKQWVQAWCRRSAIEMYVTSKHIRAWEVFVESGADYLVVLEDDVFFCEDSAKRFNEAVLPVLEKSSDRAVYIDLAGGLAQCELKIELLESSRDGEAIHYSKPVTNTACAYLVNRKLVQSFLAAIIETPGLRMIGIDWLMNRLFMALVAGRTQIVCVHYNPTIFLHGSLTGQYVSWQK